MAPKNLDNLREAHQLFNKRDFDAIGKLIADNFTYEDHPRGVTLHGRAEFLNYLKEWVSSFSNAMITDVSYIDAGNTIIAEYTGTGRNDGQIGNTPPTKKTMSVPFCEVVHFGSDGRMTSGCNYYDQMTIMVQLGIAEIEGVTVAH